MLTAAVLVAAQTAFLPIDGPNDHDGAHVMRFRPSASDLLIGHAEDGTVTRLSTTNGTILQSIALGGTVTDIAIGANPAELLVLDGPGRVLHRVSAAGFIPLGSIPISPNGGFEIFVGPLRDVAVVECNDPSGAGRVLSVIDLAVGAETRTIAVPAFFGGGGRQSFLASDDLTFVTLTGDEIQGFEVEAYDTSTGSTSGTFAIATQSATMFLAPSGDRTSFAIPNPRPAPSSVAIELYDSTTLALLSSTTILGPFPAHDLQLDSTGSNASLLSRSSVYSTMLGSGGALSSVVQFPEASAFVWSSDRTRLLLYGSSGLAAMYDSAGTLLRQLRIPRRVRVEVAPPPMGASFAMLSLGADRVRIIDGNSPNPVVLDLNTGPGAELDGPLAFERIAGADEALVGAIGSDRLTRVDLRTGIVLGSIPSGRGPHAMATRADGHVLVGHEDGTLLVVDPSVPSIVQQVNLSAPILEVFAEPTGDVAWVRVELATRDAVQRVDTGTSPATVGSQLLLRGLGNPRAIDEVPSTGTVAFDFSGGRVLASSPNDTRLTAYDLATQSSAGHWLAYPFADRRRIRLDPNGWRAFVTSSDTTTIAAQAFDPSIPFGSRWSITRTAPGLPEAPRMAVTSTAGSVVVDLSDPLSPGALGLVALNQQTGMTQASLGNALPVALDGEANDIAYIAGGMLNLTRIQGFAFAPLETFSLPAIPVGDLDLDRERGWGLVAAQSPTSFVDVGLIALDLFQGRATDLCTSGTPNATGVQAQLRLVGSPFAGESTIAEITGLQPGSMTGILVVGNAMSVPTPLGFGIGELCAGGSIGRLIAPPQVSDPNGFQRHVIDTAPLSTSASSATVLAGETRVFQLWHRDVLPNGMPTANTSTAVALTYR